MSCRCFSLSATPYPPEARRSSHPEKVCHIIRSIIRKQTDLSIGHTEPMDQLSGVRIYVSSAKKAQKVLSLQKIEVLGCTMTLNLEKENDVASSATDTLIWYNIVTDLRSLYRRYLLENFFPVLSHHCIDVKENGTTDMSAIIEFPGYSLKDVAKIQKKMHGALIFGKALTAISLHQSEETEKPSNKTSNVRKGSKAFLAKLVFEQKISPDALNELLSALGSHGKCVSEEMSSKDSTSKKIPNTKQRHCVCFNTVQDFLFFRGLYSNQDVGGYTLKQVEPLEKAPLFQEPLQWHHVPSKKHDKPRIFLCGLNSDPHEIYGHLAKQICGEEAHLLHYNASTQTAHIGFKSVQLALEQYAMPRKECMGRQVRLAMKINKHDEALVEKQIRSSNLVYAPRLVCSHRVALREMDNFLRSKLKGTSGGFVSIDGCTHALAESYLDEFMLLFINRSCADARRCRDELQKVLHDDFAVNERPMKFVLIDPENSHEQKNEKRMSIKRSRAEDVVAPKKKFPRLCAGKNVDLNTARHRSEVNE